MAGTLGHKIVSLKIHIMMEQIDSLQTFVDKTNKVIQLASSWLRNEETTNNLTYTDINKMIESKLDYLVSTDFSVCCEETSTEQEFVAERSFPPASTSTDQPLSAGYGHVSGVPVSSDEIKTVLRQVNGMQDAMSFLSSSSKNLSEKQLAMEKLVESLSEKYSKMEQEKLKEIERELESIKEKQEKASLQQDKRMTSFEKKIQEVTDSQSDIMENCHQQQSKIRQHKKENEKLKTQSQQFTKDLNDVLENIQELNTRISVQDNTSVNSTHLKGSIGSLEGRLENLSLRLEEQDSLLKELTRREEETLNLKQCESEKLEKCEDKLSALEKSWSETLVVSEKSCRDVATKYEMMYQVVSDRFVPLERLRDILNEKLNARTEHIKKLCSIYEHIDVLHSKFTQIEQQTHRQAIGFSASLFNSKEAGTLIFPDIASNIGNHYDPSTGEFTAPLDGLYATFLSLKGARKCYLQVSIVKRPCLCGDRCDNCRISCYNNYLCNTNDVLTFELVEMKAGEKLSVLRSYEVGYLSGSFHSTFSCFKIC